MINVPTLTPPLYITSSSVLHPKMALSASRIAFSAEHSGTRVSFVKVKSLPLLKLERESFWSFENGSEEVSAEEGSGEDGSEGVGFGEEGSEERMLHSSPFNSSSHLQLNQKWRLQE